MLDPILFERKAHLPLQAHTEKLMFRSRLDLFCPLELFMMQMRGSSLSHQCGHWVLTSLHPWRAHDFALYWRMKSLAGLLALLIFAPLSARAQTTTPGGTGLNPVVSGQSSIPGNPGSGGAVVPGQSTIPGNQGSGGAVVPGKSATPGNPGSGGAVAPAQPAPPSGTGGGTNMPPNQGM